MDSILVIMESSALHDDPAWSKPASGRLLALARRGLLRVAVPEVCVMELRRQRLALLRQRLDQLQKAPRKLRDALNDLSVTEDEAGFDVPKEPTLQIEQVVERFDARLAEVLRQGSVERLPLPDISHETVLARDLAGKRPFDTNGRGYRDALIWETVKKVIVDAGPGVTTYFVSADTDFGPPDSIAPELLAELPEGSGPVYRVANIDALLGLETLSEPKLAMQRALETLGPAPLESLASDATLAYLADLEHVEIDDDSSHELQLPGEVTDLEIESVEVTGEVDWQVYDEFDETTALGEARVAVEATLQGRVSKEDAAVLAEGYVSVRGWEDDAAVVAISIDAVARLSLRIEILSESVADIEFLGLEA